jgi:hypothetical protein
MASKASSDRRPRVATPADIPKLPRLGRSWYGRGVGYWARRVRRGVFVVVVMAGLCAAAVELYLGFRTVVPRSAWPACDVAEAVLAAAGAVWGWIAGRRTLARQRREAVDPAEAMARHQDNRRRIWRTPLAAPVILGVLSPVMPALAAWGTAWLCAGLATRELPVEITARRELAAKGLPAYPQGRGGPKAL